MNSLANRLTVFSAMVGLLAVFTGCTAVALEEDDDRLEPIYGLQADPNGLTLQVRSNGCTGKAHFEVQKRDGDPVQISFLRVERDLCRAYLPYGRGLQWSYAELGVEPGQRLQVINPLASIRVPRR